MKDLFFIIKMALMAAAGLLLSMSLCPLAYAGNTFQVSPSGNMSIQDALNEAKDGDLIVITSGTYPENLDVNSSVSIQGKDTGEGMPKLDGQGSSFVINIMADGVNLEGLEISNVSRDSQTIPGMDIPLGLNVEGSRTTISGIKGPILIMGDYCVLTGNTAEIWIVDSKGTQASSNVGDIEIFECEDCSFNENSGNILQRDSLRNTFIRNQGSIEVDGSSSIGLSGNRGTLTLIASSNNTVTGQEGAMVLDHCQNNLITGNQVQGEQDVGLTFLNCSNNTITGNQATGNGYAGIALLNSSQNHLVGNVARGNEGSGILLADSTSNIIYSNVIRDNGVGLLLTGCSDNILYQNNIFSNLRYDAYDDGRNAWDYDNHGNKYGNLTCVDSNYNDICDYSYTIPGGLSKDRYPLASWRVS